MPRADEYAGAVEDLEWRMKYPNAPHLERTASLSLAARCVRAMAALASGEVVLFAPGGIHPVKWSAFNNTARQWGDGADPLDAITAALGGDDAPR